MGSVGCLDRALVGGTGVGLAGSQVSGHGGVPAVPPCHRLHRGPLGLRRGSGPRPHTGGCGGDDAVGSIAVSNVSTRPLLPAALELPVGSNTAVFHLPPHEAGTGARGSLHHPYGPACSDCRGSGPLCSRRPTPLAAAPRDVDRSGGPVRTPSDRIAGELGRRFHPRP